MVELGAARGEPACVHKSVARARGLLQIDGRSGGEMAEWFKAHAWRMCCRPISSGALSGVGSTIWLTTTTAQCETDKYCLSLKRTAPPCARMEWATRLRASPVSPTGLMVAKATSVAN